MVGFFGIAESRYEFTSRKGAKAQREKVFKYPIFSFHTSIQQRRFFYILTTGDRLKSNNH
ncbi:MAG: hypothetical protein DSM106950_09980 [Stigonema ocellatum SAG 48.90 = DSM 106950]|nr:hypothetical protein [Stigonema ocellatum SAG 48.90 = DSM 106950]